MKELLHRHSVKEEAEFILSESRIVVPGVQALFGFQLIAVFNQTFDEKLSELEQYAHLAAIFAVALAMILVMAPSALHRLSEPGSVSMRFLRLTTKLLTWAMAILRIGITIDFWLISRLITKSVWVSSLLAGLVFLISYVIWSLVPRLLARGKHETEPLGG